MTDNDGTESRCNGIHLKFFEIMNDIHKDMFKFYDFEFRERLCPLLLIRIAPHGNRWCYGSQFLKHVRFTDVPGMNNQLGFLQNFESIRSNQAVCVSDDSDYVSVHSQSSPARTQMKGI